MERLSSAHGFSIIEALIAIFIVSIAVVVIGSTFSSAYKLYRAGEMKQIALSYAMESLELVEAYKNDFFSCMCGSGCTSCTAQGQTCATVNDGFTSCWTEFPLGYPTNPSQNGPLHLENQAGSWELADDEEIISSDNRFARKIEIENLYRDSSTGEIRDSATGVLDTNSKRIAVTVSWKERNEQKSATLSSIINAWESL